MTQQLLTIGFWNVSPEISLLYPLDRLFNAVKSWVWPFDYVLFKCSVRYSHSLSDPMTLRRHLVTSHRQKWNEEQLTISLCFLCGLCSFIPQVELHLIYKLNKDGHKRPQTRLISVHSRWSQILEISTEENVWFYSQMTTILSSSFLSHIMTLQSSVSQTTKLQLQLMFFSLLCHNECNKYRNWTLDLLWLPPTQFVWRKNSSYLGNNCNNNCDNDSCPRNKKCNSESATISAQ